MFRSGVTYKLALKVFAAVVAMLMTISCWDEVHPGTYYTFTGQTVASYLEQDTVYGFSSFIKVLKRAGVWGEKLLAEVLNEYMFCITAFEQMYLHI